MTPADDLVSGLRQAGCVFAEAEAREIRRQLDDPEAMARVVAARARGCPLEHALGRVRFMGLEIALGDGVFVPRERTAALVCAAVAAAPGARVAVDLGCGSGALAAVLSVRLPGTEVHGCETDRAAVRYARRNALAYDFAVHEGDWWSALPTSLRGRVDLAVAYLPHVPTGQVAMIPRDYRDHEPRTALDGGTDGLAPFRAVLREMSGWLAPDGRLVTLLAAGQVDAAVAAIGDRQHVTVDEADGDAVLRIRRGR